jgi:hypothetical protein
MLDPTDGLKDVGELEGLNVTGDVVGEAEIGLNVTDVVGKYVGANVVGESEGLNVK